ncbi:MAG: hypothetical protein ACOZQL_11295 [Myxococcota bacterium]
MSRLLVLGFVVALAGCKKDAPAPPAPVAQPKSTAEADAAFWAWVRAHLAELQQVKTGREPVTAELTAQLEKIEPGLVFELGVGHEPFEFIISADGSVERFATVKRLVAAAGELPGTKVIAFRPRKDIDGFSMTLGTQKLGGSSLWFTAQKDQKPGLIAVTVYVEGMTGELPEPVRNAAFMLLEAAVGEFDLETKIGAIDIVAAPEKPAPPLRKLKELPAVIDGWK